MVIQRKTIILSYFSIAIVQFAACPENLMVLVGGGVAQVLGATTVPRRGFVYTFLLSNAGDRFELLHRTDTPLVYFFHWLRM